MENDRHNVQVWDPVVRIGHWSLVAAFLIAYFTAEELEDVHVAAGYWIGGYVIVRTIWGFVGSRHARFNDFVRGPREVFIYLSSLIRRQPKRYLGHNPAGGAMIVAMLLCLAATVVSGLVVQADAENEGPLVPWLGHAAASSMSTVAAQKQANGVDEADAGIGVEKKDEESPYEELHELFANLTLVLVLMHLLGVITGSFLHKENLVRAMITGNKPGPAAPNASEAPPQAKRIWRGCRARQRRTGT